MCSVASTKQLPAKGTRISKRKPLMASKARLGDHKLSMSRALPSRPQPLSLSMGWKHKEPDPVTGHICLVVPSCLPIVSEILTLFPYVDHRGMNLPTVFKLTLSLEFSSHILLYSWMWKRHSKSQIHFLLVEASVGRMRCCIRTLLPDLNCTVNLLLCFNSETVSGYHH